MVFHLVLCRYGFSRARYVYSLISGVSIFTLGAGVTVYHGISGLLHPPTLEYLAAVHDGWTWLNSLFYDIFVLIKGFAVLIGSLLVEGGEIHGNDSCTLQVICFCFCYEYNAQPLSLQPSNRYN